jgi:plasmid stability protein
MAQITLYVDDALQARLKVAAAERQQSQSQFVADLVRQALGDHWPGSVLALAGSVPDFPSTDNLRIAAGGDAEDAKRVL